MTVENKCYVEKGQVLKVIRWAEPPSQGREDPLHVGVIPAYHFFVNGPYGQYPQSRHSFRERSAPACAAGESFLFRKSLSLLLPPGHHWEGLVVLRPRSQMVRLLQNKFMGRLSAF